MHPRTKAVLAAVLCAAAVGHAKTTVCTVTVNSSDERDAFKAALPADQYDFVELVEHGRPDWLASSCKRKVSCDVLVVSGHFAGTEFYSSKPQVNETLPVDELERVTCSDTCPDLFANLKEVYLFGCDTLKKDPVRSATPEIIRGLVKSGVPKAEAERFAQSLSERHSENARDRMRRVFPDVPVIYGFSSLAPYGRVAGPMLQGYFRSGAPESVGSGRVSSKLVSLFAPASMIATDGLRATDPNADYRAQSCRYYDDRLTQADKLRVAHSALGGTPIEMRMAFDRVEKLFGAVTPADRRDPSMAKALADLAADGPSRERYLAVVRDTEDPALRIRMIALARTAGWLTPQQQTAELELMIRDVLAGNALGFGEVELICGLNKERELDGALARVGNPGSGTARDAALACLGSPERRSRVIRAVSSANEGDVQIAQAYLRHRPITDDAELRAMTDGIVKMKVPGAQVRALEVLARHRVADIAILDELARLFAATRSHAVQGAIAEIFIRSNSTAASMPKLALVLREHRIRAPGASQDLVSLLLARLSGA